MDQYRVLLILVMHLTIWALLAWVIGKMTEREKSDRTAALVALPPFALFLLYAVALATI